MEVAAKRAGFLIHSFMSPKQNRIVPARAWMALERVIRSHRMRATLEVDFRLRSE
jgi:hypothetical protein